MLHAFRSGKLAVVTMLATSLLTLPQAAMARDRYCDNNRDGYSRNRDNGRYYEGRDYGYDNGNRYNGSYNYGYRNNTPSNYGYRDSSYGYNGGNYYGDNYPYYENRRSAGKSAAIIGGGAAAGAAVGAMTGGKKGALIGAAVGGIGGLIYDRSTRNRNNGYGW